MAPPTYQPPPIFSSNGHVGIGTTAPHTFLDVAGDVTARSVFSAPNTVYEQIIGTGANAQLPTWALADPSIYVLGKNYLSGTRGFWFSSERVGVTASAGSGWESATGRWHAPNAGTYMVAGAIFFNSNASDNQWRLGVYTSGGVQKYETALSVDATSTPRDFARTFSTFLRMGSGDYFQINFVRVGGSATVYFNEPLHTHMKVLQLN